MFVRTASDRDLPAIRALLIEVGRGNGAVAGADYPMASLERWLNLPRSEFLVADDGTTLAGAAFASADDSGEAVTLHELCVLPAWQGRGIGGMLLDEIQESFFESRSFRTAVAPADARVVRFYQSHGFVDTEPVAAADDMGAVRHMVLRRG